MFAALLVLYSILDLLMIHYKEWFDSSASCPRVYFLLSGLFGFFIAHSFVFYGWMMFCTISRAAGATPRTNAHTAPSSQALLRHRHRHWHLVRPHLLSDRLSRLLPPHLHLGVRLRVGARRLPGHPVHNAGTRKRGNIAGPSETVPGSPQLSEVTQLTAVP